jgi:hypothetical protein
MDQICPEEISDSIRPKSSGECGKKGRTMVIIYLAK